mgnify:CR=1 FL=1
MSRRIFDRRSQREGPKEVTGIPDKISETIQDLAPSKRMLDSRTANILRRHSDTWLSMKMHRVTVMSLKRRF